MSHWDDCDAIERHPRVSGAWVFKDTRLPVTALFTALKDSPDRGAHGQDINTDSGAGRCSHRAERCG